MGMIIGDAKVTLVEYERGAMHVECYKSRLKMVLEIVDNGGISESGSGYGSQGHKFALTQIEKQIRMVRKKIREMEKREREGAVEEEE